MDAQTDTDTQLRENAAFLLERLTDDALEVSPVGSHFTWKDALNCARSGEQSLPGCGFQSPLHDDYWLEWDLPTCIAWLADAIRRVK